MPEQAPNLTRHPEFLKLWVSETISLFGSQITLLALPLTAALALQATPGQMGILSAVEFAPFLLVGLFAGVWADRRRRRPILLWANLGRAVLLGSIPLAALFGLLRIEQLYAVGFGVGVLTVFFDIAYQAFLPTLVGRAQLVEGNSKLETSASLARIAGPGLAGGLVQLVTAPVAILLDSLSFLVSAVFLALIRTPESPPPRTGPQASVWSDIREGLGVVLGNPLLRSIAACTGTANLFSSLLGSVFVLYITRELEMEPILLGAIFAVSSVGGLIGALLAGRIAGRLGLGPAIIGAQAVSGVAGLLIPVVTAPFALAVAAQMAAWFVLGLTNPIYNINQLSLRQAITPERLQGRMNATMRFLVWGTIPLGALLGGALGEQIGLRPTLVVGVCGSLLAFFWVLFSPVRNLREQPAPVEDGTAEVPTL